MRESLFSALAPRSRVTRFLSRDGQNHSGEAAAGALSLFGFPLKVPERAKPRRRVSSSLVWCPAAGKAEAREGGRSAFFPTPTSFAQPPAPPTPSCEWILLACFPPPEVVLFFLFFFFDRGSWPALLFGVVTAAAAACLFRAPPLALSPRSPRLLFPRRAMGLLSQGSPLSWEKTQRHAEHVRKHGIQQFLHIYRAVGERHKDVLKWGDEVRRERGPFGEPAWLMEGSFGCVGKVSRLR